MICPMEEKQHMLALVEELRGIVMDIPGLITREEKLKAANRMETIKEEMKAFRRKYPHA